MGLAPVEYGPHAMSEDEIQHGGRVPVYRQLANILRQQILEGTLEPDHPLPSKRTLQERYQISQSSIEHALRILKAEGLVETTPGLGVFVLPEAERKPPRG